MSPQTLSIPPVLAFADPAAELWGVAIGGPRPELTAGRLGGAAERHPVELRQLEESGVRTLRGDAGELTAVPGPARITGPEDEGQLQPILVSGWPLDAETPGGPGVRHPGWPELKADSVRLMYASFSPERATALLAVRPRGAKGQDRDQMSVACVGEAEALTVFDPRLSSTFGPGEHLRRVGLELWLGENEEADLHSRRIAGQAIGPPELLEGDGIVVQAQPVRCHSRGDTGVGVYLLISRP